MIKRKPTRRRFLQSSAAVVSGIGGLAGQTLPGPRRTVQDPAREWRYYGGDLEATRYSPLDSIKRSNVKQLKVAWIHRTGANTFPHRLVVNAHHGPRRFDFGRIHDVHTP